MSYFYGMKLYDLGVQCALQEAGLLKEAAPFGLNPAAFSEFMPLLREAGSLGHEAVGAGTLLGRREIKRKTRHTLFGNPENETSVRSFLDHPEFQ